MVIVGRFVGVCVCEEGNSEGGKGIFPSFKV